MLGIPRDCNESVADTLEPEQLARFRECELHFRFACGLSTGADQLQQLADEAGLTADVKFMVDASDYTLSKVLGEERSQELKLFLQSVGNRLLMSTKAVDDPDKWTPELCTERAVGYGNMQLLVAAFYNVPSGTITPLWSPGRYRNEDWLPLLPRRM